MLKIAFIACILVVVTVVMHAAGFGVLLRGLMKSQALNRWGFFPVTKLVVFLALWLLLIHIAEIVVWGLFYYWQRLLPDAESAFYFSGVTYTTVGYGDVVLSRPWRILAPMEALTGILMCGLSIGLFFALVSKWISQWVKINKSSADDCQ